MNKFTPGPWSINPWHKGLLGIYSREGHAIAATVSRSVSRADRNEANARLIASAPDLLEALQAFVDHGTCFSDDDLAKARAAIAKATQ